MIASLLVVIVTLLPPQRSEPNEIEPVTSPMVVYLVNFLIRSAYEPRNGPISFEPSNSFKKILRTSVTGRSITSLSPQYSLALSSLTAFMY